MKKTLVLVMIAGVLALSAGAALLSDHQTSATMERNSRANEVENMRLLSGFHLVSDTDKSSWLFEIPVWMLMRHGASAAPSDKRVCLRTTPDPGRPLGGILVTVESAGKKGFEYTVGDLNQLDDCRDKLAVWTQANFGKKTQL